MSARQGRRTFLRAAAMALPAFYAGSGDARAGETSQRRSEGIKGAPIGPIIRDYEPQNLEFPFHNLDSFHTPNELFYVRNHFKQPELDARAWRLRVEGAVERPLELDYEELRRLPTRSRSVTLECAGNGRVLLVPKVTGTGWALGAVSNAEWSGVPLAALLDRAGVRPGAVEVVLEGADKGEIRDEPRSPGEIQFARSLPLEKARRDVLLAHRMNGETLPAAHGYPLRAVVPGWYGMASVKWLTRIVVLDRPFDGYFQSLHYTYWQRVNGLPTLTPITEIQVKAEIARPTAYETVPAGKPYRIHGAAWTGEAEVTKVEVSTDGGATWQPARMLGEPGRFTWRQWEYEWRVPNRPGAQRLMARATDSAGRTQPLTRDTDRRNYMISHVLPVDVMVK